MIDSKPRRDIQGRAFMFACAILPLCDRLLRRGGVAALLARQLAKAGTSIGANMAEATAAQTKPDFIAKACIARKEAFESHYWLRLLESTSQPVPAEVASLRDEASQIVAILTKIVSVARSSPRRG